MLPANLFVLLQPQPPVMRRKSNNDESFDVCGNVSEGQPSKHQLKKERKQARKEHKRQKGWHAGRGQSISAKENAAVNNTVESGKFLLHCFGKSSLEHNTYAVRN